MSSAVEFNPDLIGTSKMFETVQDVRQIEACAVRNEYQLEWITAEGAHVHDCLEGLGETRGERRLAIAAESDVTQL
jgi:hypothetical protein